MSLHLQFLKMVVLDLQQGKFFRFYYMKTVSSFESLYTWFKMNDVMGTKFMREPFFLIMR